MSHLIDIELVLPPRQLSVAGGELTNEVMAVDKQHPHIQASFNTDCIIWYHVFIHISWSVFLPVNLPVSARSLHNSVVSVAHQTSSNFPPQNVHEAFNFLLTFERHQWELQDYNEGLSADDFTFRLDPSRRHLPSRSWNRQKIDYIWDLLFIISCQ